MAFKNSYQYNHIIYSRINLIISIFIHIYIFLIKKLDYDCNEIKKIYIFKHTKHLIKENLCNFSLQKKPRQNCTFVTNKEKRKPQNNKRCTESRKTCENSHLPSPFLNPTQSKNLKLPQKYDNSRN